MCRIYVNFHTTLREVVSVLTGDYCSTSVRVLEKFRKSAGENKVNKSYFSNQ